MVWADVVGGSWDRVPVLRTTRAFRLMRNRTPLWIASAAAILVLAVATSLVWIKTRPTIHEVAGDCDIRQLKKILVGGGDPNSRTLAGKMTEVTPLMFAAGAGCVDAIELLLEHGAQIDASNDVGDTALHYAVFAVDIAAAGELIRHGADLNVAGGAGYTALHLAASRERMDIATLLLDSGADVNAVGMGGESPLTFAAGRNNAEMVTLFLKRGASFQNAYGEDRAIVRASGHEDSNVVKLLLDAGADPNTRGSLGRRPLIHAAEFGSYEVCRLLLEAGADPTLVDGLDRRAVDYAREREDAEGSRIAALLSEQ